ncbi:MAG: FAD-binding domain-containing protein [Flavihumibacter sp.]|nr:FAD-binding domain-containing protein [Flavihumibacter sp.]
MSFTTNYAAIVNAIDAIDPIAYAKTRNYINGAVSCLSPYLSRGVINTRMVAQSLFDKGYKTYQIEKFLQELAWRDYYQQVWLAIGDRIFEDVKQPQQNCNHYQMPAALLNASTGIEAVDDAIITFYKTGYLHNHVRMYIASIACNMGKAHWLSPSRWMYYYLLDGDLASNSLSWQWVAGTFASKQYYCNQENVNKYCHTNQTNTFLDYSYDQLALNDTPPVLAVQNTFDVVTNLPHTPLPAINYQLPVLLYNSYNLDPNWRTEGPYNRILLLEPSHFKKYPVSNTVIEFLLALSKNIPGLQLYCGEVEDLASMGPLQFISRRHPAFVHYPGSKDVPTHLFPAVTGYYNSFFSYWKKCEKFLTPNGFKE